MRSRPSRLLPQGRPPDGEHPRDDREVDRDLRLHPPDRAAHPAAGAQAARALPVADRSQPGGPQGPHAAAGRRVQAALEGVLVARHGRALDDGHRAGDLDRHRRRHARDHPVRPLQRLGRGLRPLRHRRVDRAPLLLRLRLARLLRARAGRLGVRLQVLVPRGHARRRAADLLRGGARAVAARRGDDRRARCRSWTSSRRRTTCGTSCRSSWASASSWWPASPRPPARRSTSPRATPRSWADTTPSTAACASARSSWPSTSR